MYTQLTIAKKTAACRFYRDPLRTKLVLILATRSLTSQHTVRFGEKYFILANYDALKY